MVDVENGAFVSREKKLLPLRVNTIYAEGYVED